MTTGDPGSIVDTLARDAERRFVRWDEPLWRAVIDGPATVLSMGLADAGVAPDEADRLLESYLRLACEAIGLGYLVRSSALGVENFATRAWMDLVPRLLPAARERARVLAECWNLGENLEARPPWLQRIFLASIRDLGSLDDLDGIVRRVASVVADPPKNELGDGSRAAWVDLAAADARFLPGEVFLVAPTVACVIDRNRDGSDGGPRVSLGLWLVDPPVILGPMGDTGAAPEGRARHAWRSLRAGNAWFTAPYASCANAWRAVGSLVTSQLVVIEFPANAA